MNKIYDAARDLEDAADAAVEKHMGKEFVRDRSEDE